MGRKNYRKMLEELGGWDNELVQVPAGGVREVIEDLEALEARIQKCGKGHEYVANSPEYPCPWCEVERLNRLMGLDDGPGEWFYLQDTRSIVGNCMVWWAKDCNGYTTKISDAHVFTKEEAYKRSCDRPTDLYWPKEYIDARLSRHVDAQACVWGEAIKGISFV